MKQPNPGGRQGSSAAAKSLAKRKADKNLNRVTSRNYSPEASGSGFRRDLKWETAPMEYESNFINPKVRGQKNTSPVGQAWASKPR
jgi:hypothetical protein